MPGNIPIAGIIAMHLPLGQCDNVPNWLLNIHTRKLQRC